MAKKNMHPNSLKNLRPLTAEDHRKGGIASGVAKREKKDLTTAITQWLNSPIGKDKQGSEITGTDLMVQVAIKEMSNGNPKFWELLRDTAGQKPIEKIAVAEIDQSIIDDVESLLNDVE